MRFLSRKNISTYVLLLMQLPVLMLIFGSCTESIPPRNDPTNLVTVTVKPSYLTGNVIDFEIDLRNDYDETLYGLGEYQGTIEVALEGSPGFHRTIHLGRTDMIAGPKVDPLNGKIFLDPGNIVRFFYRWDFVLDGGDTLYKKFQLNKDEDCVIITRIITPKGPGGARVSYPRQYSNQTLSINGQMKLYADLAASLVTPSKFSFQYQTYPKWQCQYIPNPP